MKKLLIGLIGAAVLGTGGYAAASGLDDAPARTVSIPAAATTTGTTTDDVTTAATTTDAAPDDIVVGGTTAGGTAGGNVDISGPCDEAEHANDPRCTGGVEADDDHSGRGRGGHDDNDDDGNDDDNDHGDRSGSNSGPG